MRTYSCDRCGAKLYENGKINHGPHFGEWTLVLTGFDSAPAKACGTRENCHEADFCAACFDDIGEHLFGKEKKSVDEFYVHVIQDEKTPSELLDPDRPDEFAVIKARSNGRAEGRIVLTKKEILKASPRDLVCLLIDRLNKYMGEK